MTTIYILKLQGGKYYIGKTDDVERRFFEHAKGNGSAWTKKYQVEKIEKTIESNSPFDEDIWVKKYMTLYGIDAVRGGSYSSVELSPDQIKVLQSEIRGALDLCQGCGERGHFIKDCSKKKTNEGINNTNKPFTPFTMFFGSGYAETFPCKNCGKEFDSAKGKTYHENIHCKEKHIVDKNFSLRNGNECFRCGRKGHMISDCYAETHVKGYLLK